MKSTLVFAVCFFCLSSLCSADWISDVDSRYKKQSPAVYAKVEQAQRLISDAKGNSEMYRQANDLLQPVLKSDPKFAPAYAQLARLVSNTGMLTNNRVDAASLKAMDQILGKALELEPKYDLALALMGYSKMFQGQLDEAAQYYAKAVETGSQYPYLNTQLADLESRRGNYAKALELTQKAYEQNKASPAIAAGAITTMLYTYQNMPGDTSQDENKWHAIRVEIQPNVAWYWSAYANFRLHRFSDYETAIKYAKKSLELMDHGVGRYVLAAANYTKWAKLRAQPSSAEEAERAYNVATRVGTDTKYVIDEFMNNPPLKFVGIALSERLKQ